MQACARERFNQITMQNFQVANACQEHKHEHKTGQGDLLFPIYLYI